MSRVLIGSLIAGVAVFLWGFVFWGTMDLPYTSMSHANDDAATGKALLEHLPQTGTYFIPGQHNPAEVQKKLFESGPVALVYFNREGKPMMSGLQMAQGLAHSIAVSFVIALALFLFAAAVSGYAERVMLVAAIGVASAIMSPVANIIWWYAPAGWQLWNALYQAVAWLIIGLIVGYFVPRRALP